MIGQEISENEPVPLDNVAGPDGNRRMKHRPIERKCVELPVLSAGIDIRRQFL